MSFGRSDGSLGRLKTNSLWLYATELLPRIGTLFIVPLWSARVQPEEFAHWVLALTGVEISLQVGNMGLSTFLVKVLYRYRDERAQIYFGMGASLIMTATVVLASFFVLGSPWLTRVMVGAAVRPDLFVFLGVYLVLTQFNNLAILYIQTRVRYRSNFVMVLSRWIINTGMFLCCLLFFHQGFYSWVWASLGNEVLTLPLSVYLLRGVPWWSWKRRMVLFAFRFSSPTLANQFLSWGQSRIGRYVLGFSGLGTGLGLFGAAQSFSQNFGGVVRPIKLVSSNILGAALEEDENNPHFMEFFHGFSCLAMSAALGGALFFQDVMRWFMAPSYWSAARALPALVFTLYMEEMFTLYHSLMFRYFKVWFDFSRTLLTFPIVVLLTLLFVPLWGFVGAAVALMAGAGTMWTFAHFYSVRVTRRRFLFAEKALCAVFMFTVAEGAVYFEASLPFRVALAAAVLVPFWIWHWRRRDLLFPTMSVRLGWSAPTRGFA